MQWEDSPVQRFQENEETDMHPGILLCWSVATGCLYLRAAPVAAMSRLAEERRESVTVISSLVLLCAVDRPAIMPQSLAKYL